MKPQILKPPINPNNFQQPRKKQISCIEKNNFYEISTKLFVSLDAITFRHNENSSLSYSRLTIINEGEKKSEEVYRSHNLVRELIILKLDLVSTSRPQLNLAEKKQAGLAEVQRELNQEPIPLTRDREQTNVVSSVPTLNGNTSRGAHMDTTMIDLNARRQRTLGQSRTNQA